MGIHTVLVLKEGGGGFVHCLVWLVVFRPPPPGKTNNGCDVTSCATVAVLIGEARDTGHRFDWCTWERLVIGSCLVVISLDLNFVLLVSNTVSDAVFVSGPVFLYFCIFVFLIRL